MIEEYLKALDKIEENYRLITLVDSYNNDEVLGTIYLNRKHKVEDFQNAVYQAKEKRADDIYEYGNDWEIISEELGDFDYFVVDCSINDDIVEF